jgi:hypothetical protein
MGIFLVLLLLTSGCIRGTGDPTVPQPHHPLPDLLVHMLVKIKIVDMKFPAVG